jgi:hypothetical protein
MLALDTRFVTILIDLSTIPTGIPKIKGRDWMSDLAIKPRANGLAQHIEKEKKKSSKRKLEQEQENDATIDRLVYGDGDGDGNIPLFGSGVAPADEESSAANAQYELFAEALVAERQLELFGGDDADAPFEDIEGKSNTQFLEQFPGIRDL